MEDEKELKQGLRLVEKKAGEIQVIDQESFTVAGSFILDIDGMIKRIKDYWKSPKDSAFKAHKEITAKENEMLKPLEEKRKAVNLLMSRYATEQERIRQEEQRRINAEREEKERKEREKLEKRAAAAEEKGQTEKAEALREKADMVIIPPVIIVPEVEKTVQTDAGSITQRKDIEVTITDAKKILQAVIDGRLPIGCVNINETVLKRAIKDNAINALDGCVIRQIVNTSFRRA